MQILVSDYNGVTITLNVEIFDLIADVKSKIEEKEGIPFDQQRLIYNSITLDDTATLAAFGIKNKAKLILESISGLMRTYV